MTKRNAYAMKRFLILLPLFFAASLLSAADFRCTTENPYNNLFRKGRAVRLKFSAGKLSVSTPLKLRVEIFDHANRCIRKQTLPVAVRADGSWETVLEAPGDRYGYFRVNASLSSGETLPKLGSRPAGCITYAVLPSPEERRLLPLEESFWGLMGNAHGKADLRPWIGSRINSIVLARTPEEYRKTLEESAKRRTTWDVYGYETFRVYNSVASQLTPEQLAKHTKGGRGTVIRFTDAEGEKLFLRAYAAVASRASWQLGINKVMRYQALWEPDLAMTDEEIIAISKTAFRAVRKADPTGILMGPCLMSINDMTVARMQGLCEKGLLNYVDEISLHPYTYLPAEHNHFVESIRALKKLLARYGKGRDIPIRGTESGYRCGNSPAEEYLKMYGLLRANLILLGEGFASNEIFYGFDFGNDLGDAANGDYGLCYNLELDLKQPQRRYSTSTVSPRPVFAAISAASKLLEGCRGVAPIEYLGRNILGYVYADRAGNHKIALWNFGGGSAEVEVPVGREKITVADIMGNCREMRTRNGSLKLKVAEEPVYLLDVPGSLWGREAERKLRLDGTEFRCIAGESAVLSGRVPPGSGKVSVFSRELPCLNRTVVPGADGRFSVRVPVPLHTATDQYAVFFRCEDAGGVLAARGASVVVTAPVKIRSIVPAAVAGTPGVEVELENLSSGNLDGMLATRIRGIPQARRRIPFALAPKQSEKLRIAFPRYRPDPFSLQKIEVTAIPRGKSPVAETAERNFFFAKRHPGTDMRIPGVWGDPRRSRIPPDSVVRSAKFHSGEKDLSAGIAAGWNDEFLLFDVLVSDDCFLQPYRGFQIWYGDSIQLGLAKRRVSPSGANDLAKRHELAYSEINFGLSSSGPVANRAVSFDTDAFPLSDIPQSLLPLSISRNGSLIHYRIAVPWTFLNIRKPVPGDTVYFALTVNDRDTREQTDVSAIGIFELKKSAPNRFGALTLLAPGEEISGK